MKYLVMCEGPNEKVIIELLLNNNLLKFTKDDLIGLEIYHARQLVPYLISQLLTYNSSNFKIIRIGDKFTDNLKIPNSLKHILTKNQIINCRTHPELEILLIINQNKYNQYNKLKNKIRAKEFAKEYINFKDEKYNNSSIFWFNYYNNNLKDLINDIKKSRNLGKNNKNEIYLADLLND